MHSQRQFPHNSFTPFSSRPVKPGHAAKRRALSVSAAQADVVVRETRGDCQRFNIFSISQLCPVPVCSCPHMLRRCILTSEDTLIQCSAEVSKVHAVQPGKALTRQFSW